LPNAFHELHDQFILPDDDSVLAYIDGTATTEQTVLVTAAITRSTSFRQHIITMIKDTDILATLDIDSVVAESGAENIPAHQEFLQLSRAQYPEVRKMLEQQEMPTTEEAPDQVQKSSVATKYLSWVDVLEKTSLRSRQSSVPNGTLSRPKQPMP